MKKILMTLASISLVSSSTATVSCFSQNYYEDYIKDHNDITSINYKFLIGKTGKTIKTELDTLMKNFNIDLSIDSLDISILRNYDFVNFTDNYIVREGDYLVATLKFDYYPLGGTITALAEEGRDDIGRLGWDRVFDGKILAPDSTYSDVKSSIDNFLGQKYKGSKFSIYINKNKIGQENLDTILKDKDVIKIETTQDSFEITGNLEYTYHSKKVDVMKMPKVSFFNLGLGKDKEAFENFLSEKLNEFVSKKYLNDINVSLDQDWTIEKMSFNGEDKPWSEVDQLTIKDKITVNFMGNFFNKETQEIEISG
ncbi:hypothetical protein SCHIN_v1c11570 [Spiroplasma chinense]|uniref:Lipoprotein n=1 Tax=Spiroplasma chinense TaxID=216932 RepID=A0A5B9Y5W5_9MOLU|nr:hypothetical protein [Spiroplasma chinense]QEH62350.1 hypothetical protein SCHIN_v1c11570 [Spiroplasma chinense]